MRRGIIVGGMVIGLLMGCNNGEIEKLENKNKFLSSIVNLGNEFLNVFTSFGDMISGETLGFKTESKKSDVANYFNKIHDKVEGTKTVLNKIVENMKSENNPNAENVGTVVKTLINEKLNKIIDGAKTASEAIGSDAGDPIGNVASGDAGGVVGKEVDNLVKGIKSIVEVVLIKEGNAEAGTDKKADDLGARTGNNGAEGEAGKLFHSTHAGANPKKAAADAAKAVGAVTGADILKAMVKNGKEGNAAKLASEGITSLTVTRDAVIAGGIALRAMAKEGKFSSKRAEAAEYEPAVKDTAVSAVTKALDALTIAIRKTIDAGLKEVKEAMKINANDSPVTSETGVAAK